MRAAETPMYSCIEQVPLSICGSTYKVRELLAYGCIGLIGPALTAGSCRAAGAERFDINTSCHGALDLDFSGSTSASKDYNP